MGTTTETVENELVQLLVREGVSLAMDSPLREPILEAVGESTGEAVEGADAAEDEYEPAESRERRAEAAEERTEKDDTGGKSRRTKAIQGTVVFVLMFVVLYVVFKRLNGDEE